jgi:hypothetical protein
MALIILRRAEERRAQNATIGKMSTISNAIDNILQEPLRQQAVRFALEVNEFVRDVLQQEESDNDFTEHVVIASFHFFHQHMSPNEMFDGDVRRVVGAFKAWLRTLPQISILTETETENEDKDELIHELTNKILATAFQQIYPDHFMYMNIVHHYCKSILDYDCSGDLAVKTLDTFFEILRSFQELGFDAALIRTVAPYKLWLAATIQLPEDHINALFHCILETINEIYFF